jgi:catechol 2,3-dioxygenase-like lactoylglutathione lyase family enzyme
MTVTVAALDHVNIRTRDIEASAAFYVETLGLRMGDPPSMIGREQARWLFDQGDRPIIHLRLFDSEPGPTGPIDHVALVCAGKAELVGRIEAQGREYQSFQGADRTVVFVRDPHGVMLELNFIGE